jgi:hypothetical protein
MTGGSKGMIVRKINRASVLGALTGAMLLSVTQTAMAQGTQSPEGIGIEATGPVKVAPTPDATSTNPSPSSVASVGVTGILTANAISASVSGNTATAQVAGLGALTGAPIAISSGTISSTCTAKADGTFTESSGVENLVIPGLTIPVNPAPNTTLSIPGVVTVILNRQTAGPTTGSVTVNAVVLQFPLLGQSIYLASSTCGPFAVTTPMASGKGLILGLGTVGAAGAGVCAVRLNRRRRLTNA